MSLVWHRRFGRCPYRRGGRLSELVVPRDLLRPVAERALAVVREGLRARPPLVAPPALVPLTRFRRLPPTAVDTVIAALDHDATLRKRVSADTSEREVGRVAWLWLCRPDAWDDELREALGELAELDGAPGTTEAVTDAQLRRRLAGAERARARAEEYATRVGAENAQLRIVLDIERSERAALTSMQDALRNAAEEAGTERARAIAELKRIERVLARRDEQQRALEERDAFQPPTIAPAPTALGGRGVDQGPDVAALRSLSNRIERSLGDAAVTLVALRAEIGLTDIDADTPGAVAVSGPDPAASARTPRRRHLAMPRGLVEDSVEAAAWLVAGRPALLVDGYNVSMAAWPDADIATQRRHLERLLGDLVARTPGLVIEIVYDGDALGVPASALPARSGINVRFTAHEVEADDELLAMIGRYPVARSVVVASTDRRVRDGARSRGANVLSAHQLLGVARA